MNFSSMEYFVTLARERSFTRAAEQLHITQQSLSAHIALLEKELGCRLLYRRIPLALTYAGEVFLRYANEVQELRRAMGREFGDLSRNQKGVLRLGAASTRGRAVLPRAIAAFQEGYPNVRVDLTEGANDALCALLRQGRLDLAIADFPETMPDIRLREFYREETVLLIRRGLFEKTYREASAQCEERFRSGEFRDLRDCPVVLGSMEDLDGRIGWSVLKGAGIAQPRIQAQSHNVGMLLELCAWGVGACFCPENLARAMLTEEQMTDMLVFRLGERARCAIRFGYREEPYAWSVIQNFMNCAKDCLIPDAAGE